MPSKNRRVKMKTLALIMLLACFGILEGSDVQGYELHSSTVLLLIVCTVSAVVMLYKSFKEDEHYGRYWCNRSVIYFSINGCQHYVLRLVDLDVDTMRPPIRTCTKCGVRLIPYTYSYIYDEINRKAIRVCKHCHDEHICRKSKNARTHGNE